MNRGTNYLLDMGDGTIIDAHAALMWQKATAGPMDWSDAMSYASGLSLGGHSDWKLPTKDELVGLYNSECKKLMDVQSSYYWSSTTGVYGKNGAWLVIAHQAMNNRPVCIDFTKG